MVEGDGMISNTREYSGKNILIKIGLFWNNKDQSRIKERRVVDMA